jgi:hypothetical protein
VSGPPADAAVRKHAVCVDAARSPPLAAPTAVPEHEEAVAHCQQQHTELSLKGATTLLPQGSQRHLPGTVDAEIAHETVAFGLFAAATKRVFPEGQGAELGHSSLKRALE